MSKHPHLEPGDNLYGRLARMEQTGEQGVLATVVEAALSTPRHLGSKMIIHDRQCVNPGIDHLKNIFSFQGFIRLFHDDRGFTPLSQLITHAL